MKRKINYNQVKLEPMIYVSDIEASIKFYTEILNFKVVEYYPDDKNPRWVAIQIGDQRFAMGDTFKNINHKYHPNGINGSGVHFYIIVDNIEEVYQKLKSSVSIIDELEKKPWGNTEFAIKDPDGYLISFSDPNKS
ncbi:MAG: VOC family protein [Promethearchaeota archaeon]